MGSAGAKPPAQPEKPATPEQLDSELTMAEAYMAMVANNHKTRIEGKRKRGELTSSECVAAAEATLAQNRYMLKNQLRIRRSEIDALRQRNSNKHFP